MELTEPVVTALAVGAAVTALVAVVLALLAVVRERRVRRAYAVFSQGHRDDVLTLLQRHIAEVERLRGDVGALDRRADELRGLVAGCVSRVATVRYDAFDEVGGQLSYSTAFLDERGDGVVLTTIHGRTDSRSYAKPVERGASAHNLSDEEAEALRRALTGGVAASASAAAKGERT